MYAVVDIETTGGSPQQSKITEIAVFLTDGARLIDKFETLINPEQPSPPFITRLTGISDEMVASAPRFQDISGQLAHITKDAVFVAHNVAFDYGMIRAEYQDLGIQFQRSLLCTVKSSRKLLPGYPSYSLGNLCKELGISIEHRHRAAGDAFATMELLHMLYAQQQQELMAMIEDGTLRFTGDPVADSILKDIPEITGVYYLLDKNKDVIYCGGGTNIRKKILLHLTKTKTRQAFELRNSIAEVNFEVTGSELLSMIVEAAEIKRLKPVFNRRHRPFQFRKTMLKPGVNYLVDKGPDRMTKSLIRIADDQVGWGYFPAGQPFQSYDDLESFIRFVAMGKEFRGLVEQYLNKGRVERIL